MFKKLVILPLLGLFILPAPSVSAMLLVGDPTEELINNIENIETVDFDIDLDFTTKKDAQSAPFTMHADLDGVWDGGYDGKFDLSFWSNDNNGEFNEYFGSMIMKKDHLYFSEYNQDWYSIEKTVVESMTGENNIDQDAGEAESFIKTLFEKGVIEYNADTVQYIDGVLTVRYNYTVNTDKLIDLMIENDIVSYENSKEAREYLSENVEIGGNFWIDTRNMLPKKLTLEIKNNPEGRAYSNFKLSALLNNVNRPIRVSAPENSIEVNDYFGSQGEDFVMSSLNKTVSNMDTDGDGLSDEDELTVWFSNPLSDDSDGDGYKDKIEVINGYDPNGSGKLDSDGDGLTDYAEMTIHWTNRFNEDSDGDGYNDGLEIANGYNPNGLGRW